MGKLTNSPSKALIDAALSLIAEKGLEGFSYRALAAYLDMTLGTLSGQVGRKEQLFTLIMDQALAKQADMHRSWRKRLGNVPVTCSSTFASILMAYMRECRGIRRNETVFLYEIIAELPRIDSAGSFVQSYLEAEQVFWTDLFGRWGLSNPAEMAALVKAFYFGDVGCMLSLGHEADYQIALSLNIDLLAQHVFACAPVDTDGLADNLLYELCTSQAMAEPVVQLEGKRLEVAEAAVQAILKHGLSGLTHRAVAKEMNVSAAAISHYLRTKAELINAGLLTMHAIMRRQLQTAQDNGLPDALSRKPPVSSFLFQAIHSLVLAGLRNPEIRPILMRERLGRGKSTADRLGRPNALVTAQVAALVLYGVELTQGFDTFTSGMLGDTPGAKLTSVFMHVS